MDYDYPETTWKEKGPRKDRFGGKYQKYMGGQRKKTFCSFKIEVSDIEEPKYDVITDTKWENFKNRISHKKEIC